MPDGGVLRVSTKELDNHILVSIIDTGMGVPEANLGRVADPFFTTKTYGTGMGLTLVEQIVKLHEATFSLKHNENGGMIATIGFKRQNSV